MAAAATAVEPTATGRQVGSPTAPISTVNQWQAANNDPGTAQTSYQRIDTQIASGGADLIPVRVSGYGTSVEVCMRYDPSGGHTTTSGPVIWLVGRDANGVVRRLADANGTKSWTLTPDSSNDCASGAAAYYTAPIVVDAMGSEQVFVLVVTAAVGTAFAKANSAAILAHVL